MNFTQTNENVFKKVSPPPFTITVILSLPTFFLACFFTESNSDNHFLSILKHWRYGIWNSKLLVFAYQMILILVLGHVLESALKLGAIIALAYGDQITNMLQPFWALTLLGITKLKAREILAYTLLMFVGSVIYILGLLIF